MQTCTCLTQEMMQFCKTSQQGTQISHEWHSRFCKTSQKGTYVWSSECSHLPCWNTEHWNENEYVSLHCWIIGSTFSQFSMHSENDTEYVFCISNRTSLSSRDISAVSSTALAPSPLSMWVIFQCQMKLVQYCGVGVGEDCICVPVWWRSYTVPEAPSVADKTSF